MTPEQMVTVQNVVFLVNMLGPERTPDALTDALTALKAAEDYDPGHLGDFELRAVHTAPKDLPALIERAADARVRKAEAQRVKNEVVARLALKVIHVSRDLAPVAVAHFAEDFLAAAADFVDARKRLPAKIDPAALIDAGPDAVQAYHDAKSAEGRMNALRRARDELARQKTRARPGGDLELGTRYTRVRNTGSARRAAQVFGSTPGPLGVWGDLLDCAGVEGFHWLSVPEQEAYIEALPAVEDRYEQVNLGGGVSGHRLVEA